MVALTVPEGVARTTYYHSRIRDGATEQSRVPSRVNKREEMMPTSDGDGGWWLMPNADGDGGW